MTVYFLALLNIHDETKYEPYVSGFLAIWQKYSKGSILAADDEPKVLEGEWPYLRTVILSFPDTAAFEAWYYSEEYQTLAKHRQAASVAKIVLLKELVLPHESD